jgi:TolA-binding protein
MEDKKVKRMFVLVLFFLTSCSSLWSHRKDKVVEPQVVSKEQYDELAKKYQDLLNTSKDHVANTPKTTLVSNAVEVIDVKAPKKENQLMPEKAAATTLDPSELVNHLDKALNDASPTVGVDALKEETHKGPPMPNSIGVQQVNHTDDIDEQIVQLRDAATMIKVNKLENALVILKDLEGSKERQIVVRAKLMLGDLLFQQGDFDLAMQAYEDIVKNHAFSGLVVKALGKLVACSEKLKQPEKQAKYYSLLHDFFEAV